MAKTAEIRNKIKGIAKTGLYISAGACIRGGDVVVKGSKLIGTVAVLTGKKVADGSRKIANTATQRGKIDERVLDSITIQSMNGDIEEWIRSEYETKDSVILKKSSNTLYTQWLYWLNEFILLNVFGHLIVIDKAKRIIQNTTSYNEEEKKLNVLALLYVEIQALKKWIEHTNANLPMHLNQEDENWLSNNIFPLTSKPNQQSQLLGRSFPHLNITYSTLLRNLNDIERSASVIGEAITVQSAGTQKIIGGLVKDPRNLNPWYLLNNSENVVANVIPGLFTGKAKNKALNDYSISSQKYDSLYSIIPPLIVETQRSNLLNISSIIDRDLNYIGKQHHENTELKRALFRRVLKLEALKRFTKIEKKQILCMSYGDVIKKIVSLLNECINNNSQINYERGVK